MMIVPCAFYREQTGTEWNNQRSDSKFKRLGPLLVWKRNIQIKCYNRIVAIVDVNLSLEELSASSQ